MTVTSLCLASLLASVALSVQPNIVIFLADDLGYGDLGCYGHARIETPHLDRFAAQGMRFTQCYAASAVCSPSRSAILTGRTPHRNGVFTWIAESAPLHLPVDEITLPKILQSTGYATCHCGKWHLNGRFNQSDQPQPGDHGYDWWFATQNNAAPSHENPVNFVRNGQPVGPLEGYSAHLVVEEAIDWLTKHRDLNKPFFLTVWTHEPHYPIKSNPEFKSLYRDISDEVQREYFANVSQMDDAFGRLMSALEDFGIAEDTIVFFTSDNGPEGDGVKTPGRGSTGGLRGRKRSLYEGGIRVPGVVRWPGHVAAGSQSDVPIIGSDLCPTILAAAGMHPPADRQLDGTNLLPVLRSQAVSIERQMPLYWRLHMAPGPKIALRVGEWKILANAELDSWQLYNLATDPGEKVDLHQSEPEKLNELRAQLLTHNTSVEAEGPSWWKTLNANGGQVKKSTGN